MQHDLQQQVPFGVGLICSSWFPTGNQRSKKSQHACYLNAFRVHHGPDGEPYAVKTKWHVAPRSVLSPSAQVSMGKVLQVSLTEAEETRKWLIEEARNKPGAQMFIQAEYEKRWDS